MLFLQSFLQRREFQIRVSTLWEGMQWHRPVIIGFTLLGYILVLDWVGFIPCSLLIILVMLNGLEKFSWGKAIFISVMASTFSYLIFSFLLKVMLPKGIFWF